jgi:hypothetical protein
MSKWRDGSRAIDKDIAQFPTVPGVNNLGGTDGFVG